MKIIYTEHAEQRALLRGVKKEWIEEAIRNPDKLIDAKEGKKQAIKRVDANNKIVNEMEISLDLKADALYIKFQEGKFFQNKRIDEDTIVDLDSKGKMLGIEVLNITKKVPIAQLSDVNVRLPLRA